MTPLDELAATVGLLERHLDAAREAEKEHVRREGFRGEDDAYLDEFVMSRRDAGGRFILLDAVVALAGARVALEQARALDDGRLLCPHGAVACSRCITDRTADMLAGRL